MSRGQPAEPRTARSKGRDCATYDAALQVVTWPAQEDLLLLHLLLGRHFGGFSFRVAARGDVEDGEGGSASTTNHRGLENGRASCTCEKGEKRRSEGRNGESEGRQFERVVAV